MPEDALVFYTYVFIADISSDKISGAASLIQILKNTCHLLCNQVNGKLDSYIDVNIPERMNAIKFLFVLGARFTTKDNSFVKNKNFH